MIEGLFVAMGALTGIVMLVGFIGHAVVKHDTAEHLRQHLARCDAEEVRALLIARGHLLRDDVRAEAKLWLLEHDNEKS